MEGFAIALSSQGMAIDPGTMFIFTAVVSFVTGTMFLVWLGEQVNERGIGQWHLANYFCKYCIWFAKCNRTIL